MIHTLRGVFPEPKKTPKKNFIKENVKQIKQMQGLLGKNPSESDGFSRRRNTDKFQNVPSSAAASSKSRSISNKARASKSSTNNTEATQSAKPKFTQKQNVKKTREHQMQTSEKAWNKLNYSSLDNFLDIPNEKITHRSVQTESTSDLTKLYQSGVIKYPSPFLTSIKSGPKKNNSGRVRSLSPPGDRGDGLPENSGRVSMEDGISSELGSLRVSERHDFVKENALAVKQRMVKPKTDRDPNKAPPEYKKGVVPKYIQERKEEILGDVKEDLECPDGHVLLPEEERKETLRVLRQSYAERVQELNGMPVRTDTLRQRKRKMEIEEELKKIDEGIKVFQRPKVYVKINS